MSEWQGDGKQQGCKGWKVDDNGRAVGWLARLDVWAGQGAIWLIIWRLAGCLLLQQGMTGWLAASSGESLVRATVQINGKGGRRAAPASDEGRAGQAAAQGWLPSMSSTDWRQGKGKGERRASGGGAAGQGRR